MRLSTSAIVFAVTVGGASAQGMDPLPEVFEQAAAAYAPARCGALYQATMEWAGRDRLGEETWQQTDATRELMILVSAQIAQSVGGGTLDDQIPNTLRDVRNIADLYLTRFEANYAASGQAFGADQLVQQDLSFCRTLTEQVLQ